VVFTAEAVRVLAKKTQAEVAEKLGLGRVTYLRREKEPWKLTVEQMQKFCQELGVRHVGGNAFAFTE